MELRFAFDLVVIHDLDRFHLVADVIARVPALGSRVARFCPQEEGHHSLADFFICRWAALWDAPFVVLWAS